MKFLFITIALAACSASSDSTSTPDASPPYNPTGTWSLVNTYQGTCLTGTSSDTLTIIGASPSYSIGDAGKMLQPNPSMTCSGSSCSINASFAWSVGSIFHYRSYTISVNGNALTGTGEETINGGSGGCTASFSTTGSRS